MAVVLGSPTAALAEGSLSVTGIRQEAGLVEFYLSGSGLPSGTSLKPDSINVAAGDTQLQATAEQVSSEGQTNAPKRAVVLVLDTSGSMKDGGAMDAAKAAAKQYIAVLPKDVKVAIVTAGAPSTTPLGVLTSDRSRAVAVIDGLQATGETALYDGIRIAAELIKKGELAQRRILVLSDGADTRSKTTLPEATGAVSGVAVDTIGFRTEATTSAILANLAKQTGGRSYSAADPAALASAFGEAVGSFAVQLLVKVKVPAELAGKATRLKVTAALSSGAISTDVPVTLVPDTRAATDLQVEESFGTPGWLQLVLIALIFLGLLALGVLIFSPMADFASRRRRLAEVDAFSAVGQRPKPVPADQESGQMAQAALALSSQVMKQTQSEGRMAMQLDRAGMRMRPHEWLLLRGVISLVFMFPFSVILQRVFEPTMSDLFGTLFGPFAALLLGIPVGLFFGWGTTAIYYQRKAAQRVGAFRAALPDALQLIVGSLRSGFSLPQAIDAMVREFPEPISGEFGRALGETRLGVDIEDALGRVATRMQNKDLDWAVVAVRVQREVGGNLAEVLSTTIATMREREQLRRQVKSLSAEGRMSAYVLLALPLFVVAFLAVFRGEYLSLLYTTPLGVALGVTAVALMSIGAFWISQVIKVEV